MDAIRRKPLGKTWDRRSCPRSSSLVKGMVVDLDTRARDIVGGVDVILTVVGASGQASVLCRRGVIDHDLGRAVFSPKSPDSSPRWCPGACQRCTRRELWGATGHLDRELIGRIVDHAGWAGRCAGADRGDRHRQGRLLTVLPSELIWYIVATPVPWSETHTGGSALVAVESLCPRG